MMSLRILITALVLSFGATLSAQATTVPDLPRLTWPTTAPITAPAPVSQNCTAATQPGARQGCPQS